MPARLRRRSAPGVLAALALLLLAVGAGGEAPILVEVVVSPADAAEEVAGSLAVAGGGASGVVRTAFAGPGRVAVPAAAGSVMVITPEVAGFWGAPVAAAAGGDPVLVRLFPTGRIGGSVQVPRGTAAPDSLRASFQAPLAVRALGAPAPEGAVDCPIADGRWSCTLPEGVLDLRLHAPGFASVLRWEVAVEAGAQVPGGTLALVPGAAVLGQVALDGAGDAPGPVEVEIRPDGAGWRDAHRAERLGHLFRTVEVDRRGSFQFRDLAPGSYRVEARAAGRASAVRAAVEVQEGRETDLGAPLVLAPPSRLEVHLDPLTAPDGERWTVRLSPLDGEADAHVARVDWTGFGRFDDLAPGTYRCLVTSRGSTWSTGEVEVAGDVTIHAIELPLVPVEGIVRRGDEPARARIVFGGGREHPERIEMFADPEGRFSGHLPREGRWPAFVTVERGGAEQGLDPLAVARAPGEDAAWLEIELFDTAIRGRVVDAGGRPVAAGAVIATRSGSAEARRTTAHLDREGRFRMRGVRPGTWTLDAAVSSDGGRVVVDLAEGGDEEVEIRLLGTRRLAGRVISPRGPVAAARLWVIPEVERTHPLRPVKSGPLGEFDHRVPADTTIVHLLVMPPGYAARILSLSLPPGRGGVDDLEVRVGEAAGTLRLELPESGVDGVELRRGTTRVYLQLLAEWAGFHGARPADSWELPAMEAGVYALCRRDRCDGGTLGPAGTLVLRLGSGEDRQRGPDAGR